MAPQLHKSKPKEHLQAPEGIRPGLNQASEGLQPGLNQASEGVRQGTAPSVAPTMADLFASAHPPEKDYSRLLLAICGSMVVIAASVCGAMVVDRIRLPDMAARTMEPPGYGELDADKTLRDVLDGQRKAAVWDPGAAAPRQVTSSMGSLQQSQVRAGGSKNRALKKLSDSADVRLKKPEAESVFEDGTDPIYAAQWGSGDRYASLGQSASSEAERTADPSGTTRKPDSTGVVLPARLLDRVAGAPARAPVMAILTRKAVVGGRILPIHTELHGTVAGMGGEDNRIFLDFDFARLRDGQTHSVRGVARDTHGRYGIPASKVFGKKAAGSVGLHSASRVARRLSRLVAGQAGDVIGEGLEGATDSATDKASRADPDEWTLVAEPGMPFAIYVTQSD